MTALPITTLPAPGVEQPLIGLTVIVTGELEGVSRQRAQEAVARLGGKPVNSVSAKTGLAVLGAGAGLSKLGKIRQWHVPVLDGDEFLALIEDPAAWEGRTVGEPLEEWELRNGEDVAEPEPPAADENGVTHHVSMATCYSGGGRATVREVRASCTCGIAWLGSSLGAGSRGCPDDPHRADLWTTTLASIEVFRPADSAPWKASRGQQR